MTHWSRRLPARILSQIMAQYGTEHISTDHVVDWLLTQELDRLHSEKFTFEYDMSRILNHIGDANESDSY
jgi:hypothetical protein